MFQPFLAVDDSTCKDACCYLAQDNLAVHSLVGSLSSFGGVVRDVHLSLAQTKLLSHAQV